KPWRAAGADQGLRLRRVPHGPSHRQWRVGGPQAAAGDRAHGGWPRRRTGRWCEPLFAGRAHRRALARLRRRNLPLLPPRPREPLPASEIYRLPPRWRLCRVSRRRRALLLSAAARILGLAGGTTALRRLDWLSRPAVGRRRAAARTLWFWRLGAHHCPGRPVPGPPRLRVHVAGRLTKAGLRP